VIGSKGFMADLVGRIYEKKDFPVKDLYY